MNPRIGLSRRNFVTGAAASAVIATPRISAAAGPTIRVQPDNDLQDIPLSIPLSGFSPRQPVMVTAEMVTRDHFRWRSAEMFVIDGDGEVCEPANVALVASAIADRRDPQLAGFLGVCAGAKSVTSVTGT
jgi:hypothetical protein